MLILNSYKKCLDKMPRETNDYTTFKRLVFVQCLVYGFYPILCISLITTASIFKTTIDYYAQFTNVNLNVVSALIISAGCIGFAMILTRLCFDKITHLEVMCYGIFPLLFILQIIAAVYGCVQSADRTQYLRKAVERDMENLFSHYYSEDNVEQSFNTIQNELECCGVYSYKDYTNLNKKLPKSCCASNYIGEFCIDDTKHYNAGCASKVYEQISFNIGLLSYITFGLIGLQIFSGMVIGGIILIYFKDRIRRHYQSIQISRFSDFIHVMYLSPRVCNPEFTYEEHKSRGIGKS